MTTRNNNLLVRCHICSDTLSVVKNFSNSLLKERDMGSSPYPRDKMHQNTSTLHIKIVMSTDKVLAIVLGPESHSAHRHDAAMCNIMGLTRKKHLDKAINKAYKAFWTCRGTFGKTWGLKPKVVYWIYTVVVRPIITYAATIWWPRVKLKTSQAELSKPQMMACLGITGAMRIAPTAAMEVLLGLPPLHLQVEAETRIGNYRLRCK
jgi:hypothetical protein